MYKNILLGNTQFEGKAMRKILIFVMISISFLISFPKESRGLDIFANALGVEEGYIYTTSEDGEKLFQVNGITVYQQSATIDEIVKRIDGEDMVGITVVAEGNTTLVEQLITKFNIEIKSTQNILNKKIIYAYSEYLNGYNLAKARESNMQISVSDNKIIVGIPVIVGSF